MDAWAVCTNKSFATMGGAIECRCLGANVLLPKQLLLEAVKDIVSKPAGRESPIARMSSGGSKSILQEGYEGVGWTIFKAGRQLDQARA